MQPLFPGDIWIECMNKVVNVLGTPKKADWPEGFKMASGLSNSFLTQDTTSPKPKELEFLS